MNTIFIDFESVYDRNYSLSKMTTPEYICDPRFKVLGVAIAIDDEPAQWYETLPDLDWANSTVVAHNCYFDAMILTLHYGIKARHYVCTQALARYALPVLTSNALKAVAPALGLGNKTEGLTEGATSSDTKLIDYALNDVELCRGIYNRLWPSVPEQERFIHSLTIRWGVEPVLRGNVTRLLEASIEAADERDVIIKASGVPEEVLVSNKQFAEYVTNELGIEIAVKGELQTPCLSKGDAEFQKMISDHPEYDHIWQARLAAKSNININRPKALANVCLATPNNVLPMPLKWCGAHTLRFSGHDSINVQNLPNGSVARTAIEAPPGHVIVVCDSSQIELRVNAWWSREEHVLNTLRSGKDIYITTAAAIYNQPYESISKTDPRRKLGKAATLGAGFGMGWYRFQQWCATGPLGMDPIHLTDKEAQTTIQAYRKAHPNIVKNWERHDSIIRMMFNIERELPEGLEAYANRVSTNELKIGPITVGKRHIRLPNDMCLWYPGLTCESDDQGNEVWRYHGNNYIYGAKCVENIVQALARVIITDQIYQMESEGLRTVSSTHDEILVVAKESDADATLKRMIEIMSTTPEWAKIDGYPVLTLGAEGAYDRTYCK